ncbi:MAG: PilZ domain-containing protein [Deltaproteobacteria bacterium]|nr:PilZ domain-containing protein [Deltaproteobacteria bacterium]
MARPRKRLPLLDQVAREGHQRLFERRQTIFSVWLEDEHGDPLMELSADNLSVSGLFLRTRISMRVGARLLLRFQVPNQTAPIRVVGEVVRVAREEDPAQALGLGVRFIELEAAVRRAIEQWIHAIC